METFKKFLQYFGFINQPRIQQIGFYHPQLIKQMIKINSAGYKQTKRK